MRLIDADALENELGIDDRDIYVKYTLEDAPTIDAIPVEWIKQVSSKGFDYMHCAGVILGLWKQQEANNATDRP